MREVFFAWTSLAKKILLYIPGHLTTTVVGLVILSIVLENTVFVSRRAVAAIINGGFDLAVILFLAYAYFH